MIFIDRSSSLSHYGVLGMHWGVRKDGKPQGYQGDGKARIEENNISKRFNLTDKQKKNLKRAAIIGGVALGTALAAYGIYKLNANSNNIKGDIITDAVSKNTPKVGLSSNEIDKKMVSSINASNVGKDGTNNCVKCSTAYVCNSAFGKDVSAKGGKGELETVVKAFNGVKEIDNQYSTTRPSKKAATRFLSELPSGSTGILKVSRSFGGKMQQHAINYEKDLSGITTLIDSQQRDTNNQIMPNGSSLFNAYLDKAIFQKAYDFTDASIDENGMALLTDYLSNK